jgi:hypothetical protein
LLINRSILYPVKRREKIEPSHKAYETGDMNHPIHSVMEEIYLTLNNQEKKGLINEG